MLRGARRRTRRAGKTLAAGLSNGISRIFSSPLLLVGALIVVLCSFDALIHPYYCLAVDAKGQCTNWTTGPTYLHKACSTIDKSAPYLKLTSACDFIKSHPNRTTGMVDGLYVSTFKVGSRLLPTYLAGWLLFTSVLPEYNMSMYASLACALWLFFVQKKTTNRRLVLLFTVVELYFLYKSGF